MIKIIAGVYGYKDKGFIVPKDKDSEPFSLSPEREAQLVERGVAEYANVEISEPNQDQNETDDPGEQDNEPTREENPEETDPEEPEKKKPEYSDRMKLTELQELAKILGLDAKDLRTKAEVIKLLDEYFAEDDAETPPDFGAIDPVE